MKVGFAFGDHIKTEKIKRRRHEEDAKPVQIRWYFLPALMIVVGGVLFFNLFLVQIIQGNYYQTLADSNRIRTHVIPAARGVIFDRHGTPLVYNIPGFRSVQQCHPEKKQQCKIIHLSREQALPRLAKGDKNIEVDSLREYRYKDALSHVLGYTGQLSEEEVKSGQYDGYVGNEWIGKTGLEHEYEQQLHGQDGKTLIEVNAMGEKVRSLGQTDPVPGKDITLTIDVQLQKAVYEAAKEMKKGAIVVSKPDGEVLAMFSKPTFDPNLFTLDTTYKAASESGYTTTAAILLDSQNQPLLHRAIGGTYPPGSTFKIVTAAAGLNSHLIDEKYQVADTGVLKVGEFSFANWYYTDYGQKEAKPVNVVSALARSNDIFFYKLAEKVTVDKLSAYAEKMGVGKTLGIDLGGEMPGLLPSKEWKKKTMKEDWYLGDTFHYGIGQGYLLTTPLQVNAWTQIVANGGTLYIPRLIKADPVSKEKNILDTKTISLITQGMIDSCRPGGVAFPFYDFKVKNAKLKVDGKNYLSVASASSDMRQIPVACKTGTAQHGGEKTLPHAWITLFAPAYKPEIVVTVLNESAGEGSKQAAPIAKKILDAYFEKK